ncbi:gliding motility-associated C-terminal domain-containing protein [Hymenobacter arizonensis]|uniref:Gliding motility-associated C-terminal domain-containing protein n=1 Tax=Hymenobacter arizonensis TaxID=1227077 RepID=A0A1I5YYW4_HYMAR|nr:gliding motility-associated C-terminal domain-containing protein [Hymenobacter arizonensis]SFQ49245.1 gliding motility-associated C-terminal domain-containing protein [Hymenobacter arizonensis]
MLRNLYLFLLFLPLFTQAQNTCPDLFPLDAPAPATRSLYANRTSVSERFAIVGANWDVTASTVGRAHIYEYTGGVWVFRQTLIGDRVADSFGSHVFIDENTVLVSASNYTRPGSAAIGAVYAYTRQGSVWVQSALIPNPNASYTGGFGWSLAKSGPDLVVGCGYSGTQNYAAYVYRQTNTQFALVATLTPPAGTNIGYDFGYSVAIDGDNLVIGALDAFSFGQSAAYFYHRSAAGAWSQAQVEVYPNGSRAGFSIALHGQRAAVGSDSNLGVRLYERTAGRWQLRQTMFNPDATPGRYGYTVAMNEHVLLVSNPFDRQLTGVVYRYGRQNNAWQLERRYFAPQPLIADGLGTWVAVDAHSNNFILSAPGRTSGGALNAGQAFVQWAPAILPAGPFCASDPALALQATATGGTWSGPGVSNSGVFTPALAGLGTHRIAYALSAGPTCTYRDTLTITVQAAPRITRLALPPLSCARDTAFNLTATLPGGLWSGTGIANPQTGTFQSATAGPGRHVLTYSLNTACGSQDTLSVVVRPAPVRILTARVPLSCARDTTMALVASQPGGAWSGAGIAGVTSTFQSALAGPGRHLLTYRVPGPCGGQDTLSLVVRPVPVRVLSRPSTFCRTDTVFSLQATPAGGRWRGPGVTDQGRFTPPGPGRYVLRYERGTGACRAADSVAMTITPLPQPVVNALPTQRCGEPTGVLRLSSQTPSNTTYEWQHRATTAQPWQVVSTQPTHQPAQPGWYQLKLSQGTCRAYSAPTEFRAEPMQVQQIPNVFTPNGDRVNDVFELRLQYPRTSQLQVFDRWGKSVYASTTYGAFWTGEQAAAGVYYYLWRYSTDCEPVERTVKGWVELLR